MHNAKQTCFFLKQRVFIVNEDIKKRKENDFRPDNTDSLVIVILSRLFKWQKKMELSIDGNTSGAL